MANLIFGCGYLGLRVARLWQRAGIDVFAVTRTEARARQLAAEGIQALLGDINAALDLALPPTIRTVLFAVGSGHNGLANALAALPESVERFIYISSTGVYGQNAGEEVDEDSPCRPLRAGGRACLAAEELLRASRWSERAIVLRLAGLYGPGRIPRAADLVAGRPIDAPAAGWLNLIHVDDAARIVVLAEQHAAPPCTYVVSDGHPVPRREYYTELARLLGAPPPRFCEPVAGSSTAQRAASDKRVSPRRLFAEIGPTLDYPTYREGLAAIVAGEQAGARTPPSLL
jgi:nucleoside-diphosphate-sugar epimerase